MSDCVAHAREYDLQGLGLRVHASRASVAAAVQRRLAPYASVLAQTPDLDVHYVDELSDAVVLGAANRGRCVYETPAGALLYAEEEDVLTADFAGVLLHADLASGVVHIAGSGWTGRAIHLATHSLTTLVLMEIGERRGRYAVHAGCLARSGRGVMVAGPSGAGKSTLVLALARLGLDHLSDDLTFLRTDGDGVAAHGFADVVGVTADTLARFPEIEAHAGAEVRQEGFPKHLVRMENVLPTRYVSQCRPAMLVFPQIVAGDRSELRALEPREAWLRLLPDVMLTHPSSTEAHVGALSALTGQVECFELLGGGDVDRSARLIAGRL